MNKMKYDYNHEAEEYIKELLKDALSNNGERFEDIPIIGLGID